MRMGSPASARPAASGASKVLRAASLLALAFQAPAATATDLMDVWRAAMQADKEYAVGAATRAAAQPRRDQAAALWRPTIGLSGSAGLAGNASDTLGARFNAPGFGQSHGAGFSTSVAHGTTTRWAITATQPLYNPERRAQQQQLTLSADLADLEWQAAGQSLMLRTAERYFDLALAEETVRVLEQQSDAAQRAATEAQDRFKLGSVPITDTHEASARLAGIRARALAARSDAQIKRNLLADSTGLRASDLAVRLPADTPPAIGHGTALEPLDFWLIEAQSGNPSIRARLLAVEVASQEVIKYSRQSSATVDLVAQLGRDRLSGSGDFGPASNTATHRMIGVQLSMPLFTGGYRNAREEEALRLADKAMAEAERTREQVSQQVRTAWLGLSVGAERVQALQQALGAGMARRDATRLGREVGDRTTLDLLDAENEAAATRLALAQARVGLLMDRLRLAALVGQLDETALQAAAKAVHAASR